MEVKRIDWVEKWGCIWSEDNINTDFYVDLLDQYFVGI